MFGFKISSGTELATLPFSSSDGRKMFTDAVTCQMKSGATGEHEQGESRTLHQAKQLCELSVPDLLLHLVTPIGHGPHRDMAVTATTQAMHVPGMGVAAIVMGFEQIDPQLWSLRVFKPAGCQHQESAFSVSGLSYDDEVNLCACEECRSDATSSCSRMKQGRGDFRSRMSESDRGSSIAAGAEELGYHAPLVVLNFLNNCS